MILPTCKLSLAKCEVHWTLVQALASTPQRDATLTIFSDFNVCLFCEIANYLFSIDCLNCFYWFYDFFPFYCTVHFEVFFRTKRVINTINFKYLERHVLCIDECTMHFYCNFFYKFYRGCVCILFFNNWRKSPHFTGFASLHKCMPYVCMAQVVKVPQSTVSCCRRHTKTICVASMFSAFPLLRLQEYNKKKIWILFWSKIAQP